MLGELDTAYCLQKSSTISKARVCCLGNQGHIVPTFNNIIVAVHSGMGNYAKYLQT